MAAPARKIVKSAQRTLEVLEYFGPDRHEATASDVARDLRYPISSTAELLWSMVELGYLDFNTAARKFHPTAKLPLLGYWVLPRFFKHGVLLSMMEGLAATTGAKIVLAAREGVTVRYLHAIRTGGQPVRSDMMRGSGRCMFHSAMGRLFLAGLPVATIPKVVHRLNAEITPEWRVVPAEIISELGAIRNRKVSITVNRVTPDVGAIAIPLPELERGQELGLGISGTSDMITNREEELVALLRATSKALTQRLESVS